MVSRASGVEVPPVIPNCVLLVEDSPGVREVLSTVLQWCGVKQVEVADCGRQAVDILHDRGSRIDCVVADLSMHHGNGLQLLKWIRCGDIADVRPDTCVLLMSAFWSEATIQDAWELDVNAVLTKPFSRERLREELLAAWRKPVVPDEARYRLLPPAVSQI
jgi:CheY-like chemotaxis protein